MANLSRFSKVLMRQLEKKKIDQEMLRRAFPVMKFHLAARRENPLSRFLFSRESTIRKRVSNSRPTL